MADKTPQKQEVNRLINQGFPFLIEYQKKVRKPGLLGLFQKRQLITEKRELSIKEPTLHQLDRIALLALKINSQDILDAGRLKRSVVENRYYRLMAKVIAIMVAEHQDDEPELEEVLLKTLKPSILKELIDLVDIVSNLPDFISSILSVAAVTKLTERIEKEGLSD